MFLDTLTASVSVFCSLNTVEAGELPLMNTMMKLCLLQEIWLLFSVVIFVTAAPMGDANYNPMLIGGDFEGDILLPKFHLHSDTGSMRSGLRNTRRRWLKNTVFYELDPAFKTSESTLINSAMNEIASKTCIRFTQRTTQTDYVYVVRGAERTGCNSYIGRIGGRQTLNLQVGVPSCISHGIIAHEFIHAIGFYHEQSRTDRDEYVTINWSNIPEENKRSFNKYSADLISNFGVPYDYKSVMHYGAYFFAINQTIPTIIVPEGVRIGQRDGLSKKDAAKIKLMYNC